MNTHEVITVVSNERKIQYAQHLEHKINAYRDKLALCPKNAPLRSTIEKIVTADEARLLRLKMQING
jgi:hypothetical protein